MANIDYTWNKIKESERTYCQRYLPRSILCLSISKIFHPIAINTNVEHRNPNYTAPMNKGISNKPDKAWPG